MRAIVVDDEKLALDSLRIKLSHIDRISEIQAFLYPGEALEYVAENGADIVFLDISMSRMNGITLASRMREIKPNILLLFVTGYSEYALDALKLHADGYLMKPVDEEDIDCELDALEKLRILPRIGKHIRIQCFGDFEVFVDEIPVVFARSKSKELLAYLVDRRGAKCTPAQIASVIWDDGIYDRQRQKLLSAIRSDLIKSLKKAEAEKIINNDRYGISIVLNSFDCDYYRVMENDIGTENSFAGEYMAAYSWAEYTTAAIAGKLPE